MEIFNLTRDGLEEEINKAKSEYLVYLHNNKFIDDEAATFLDRNTAILLRKPSFFSDIWYKLKIKRKWLKKGGYIFMVVEQKTLEEENEKEREE